MGKHYLENFFSPYSIAVIGASDRSDSIGHKVFQNLLNAGFEGKLYPINPKHSTVQNRTCFSSVTKVSEFIDLAIIATPAKTVPDIIRECGKKRIRSAIVLSSGFSEEGDDEARALEQEMLSLAKQHHVRLIGPNCLGVMRPHIKMNATFDNNFALSGSVAFISQSGALSAGILDWAMNKKIGFSAMASLGNNADINFGDVIDYFAHDIHTKSILLYIEGIREPRRFMSALRSAASRKPVIVLKAGKNTQGSRAALSHTGALIGDDEVFDAALRRAGAVRVMKIEDLFSASEIVSDAEKIGGNRLAIITNGGGAGVIAADRASELKIELPPLSAAMLKKLNEVLPKQWSHHNPIDIIGDATPKRYRDVLRLCKKEENIDGILVILVPVALAAPFKVAKQIIKDAKETDKSTMVCWLGEKQVKSSWKLFAKHKIPCFDTPEKAVEAFSYLARYRENQKLLMQIPAALLEKSSLDIVKSREIIEFVLAEKRTVLTTIESKTILNLFDIPVIEAEVAKTADEAVFIAKKIGFPLVMKIYSKDISHKSDVGGVMLHLRSDEEVKESFETMMSTVKEKKPDAVILGVTLEKEISSPNDREVMIGVKKDKVFGPVISLGAGGVLVEILQDRAVALPPLNQFLAEQLISETKISKLLGAFRAMPPAKLEKLVKVLLRVSELVCELPFIQEMDINPLLIDENRIIAVDARIVVADLPASFIPYSHLVIPPYPHHLISLHQIRSGETITVRPIRAEDAELEKEFIKNLSAQSKYFRFMENFDELSPYMLLRLTQIDYDREMAFAATIEEHHREKIIGGSRYIINVDNETAEFALVVADEWHDKGIGTLLMNRLFETARLKKIKLLIGVVLAVNSAMLELLTHLGFEILNSEDPKIKVASKKL